MTQVAGHADLPPVRAERVDERDTMFARMARRPGTPEYDDYYGRLHPERKAVDDRLRAMPFPCEPGGRWYDPDVAADAIAWFDGIGRLRPEEDRVARGVERLRDASDPKETLLRMARSLGAVAAGVAPVWSELVYSHKGRHDADYGRPIDLRHETAIVFLVEMDHAAMQTAPRIEALRESARQYWRGARVSLTLAEILRRAGHEARSHHDASYDVILPPLAVLAGLGELGRNNILVADRFGSRVRIGAVTTDLALPPDAPISLGVERFCEICGKCADNCPSRSLSREAKTDVNGVPRWLTDAERCHAYWRRAGSDCGICMAVCPFSHRDTAFHRVVRAALRRLPSFAPLALRGDDFLYGRDWRRRRSR